MIAVVMEFDLLSRQPLAFGQRAGIADVVMRAYEERVARIVEKRTDGCDLRIARPLLRPRGSQS